MLTSALAAKVPSVFQLSGNATFSHADYSNNGVSYPQSTAINFVVSRIVPLRFYVTANGLKVLHPEYYQAVSTAPQSPGGITMGFNYLATKTHETYSAAVTDTSTSIDYSFLRQFTTGSGSDYYQISNAQFTASITPIPEANWAPAPAYAFTVSPVGSRGMSLAWKHDNDPASIKEYQVLKDRQLVATVTNPSYTDTSGLTCDTLGTCIADYAIVVVPQQGHASVPATVTCTTMYLTPLSCLPPSYAIN